MPDEVNIDSLIDLPSDDKRVQKLKVEKHISDLLHVMFFLTP